MFTLLYRQYTMYVYNCNCMTAWISCSAHKYKMSVHVRVCVCVCVLVCWYKYRNPEIRNALFSYYGNWHAYQHTDHIAVCVCQSMHMYVCGTARVCVCV